MDISPQITDPMMAKTESSPGPESASADERSAFRHDGSQGPKMSSRAMPKRDPPSSSRREQDSAQDEYVRVSKTELNELINNYAAAQKIIDESMRAEKGHYGAGEGREYYSGMDNGFAQGGEADFGENGSGKGLGIAGRAKSAIAGSIGPISIRHVIIIITIIAIIIILFFKYKDYRRKKERKRARPPVAYPPPPPVQPSYGPAMANYDSKSGEVSAANAHGSGEEANEPIHDHNSLLNEEIKKMEIDPASGAEISEADQGSESGKNQDDEASARAKIEANEEMISGEVAGSGYVVYEEEAAGDDGQDQGQSQDYDFGAEDSDDGERIRELDNDEIYEEMSKVGSSDHDQGKDTSPDEANSLGNIEANDESGEDGESGQEYTHCQATTKSGGKCKRKPIHGKPCCQQHS